MEYVVVQIRLLFQRPSQAESRTDDFRIPFFWGRLKAFQESGVAERKKFEVVKIE